MTRQVGSSIKVVTLASGAKRWRFRVDLPPTADGKRRQQTLSFRSEEEAIIAQARHRVEVADGDYIERDPATIAAVLDEYELAQQAHWKPSTLVQNRSALKVVRAHLGDRELQKLTRGDVDRFASALRTTGGRGGAGRSPRTIQVAVGLLAAAVDLAHRDGRVRRNVVRDAKLAPVKYKRADVWTPTQLQQFIDYAAGGSLEVACHLLAHGLRRGEVLGLTWGAVDESDGTIHVQQARVVAGRSVATGTPKSEASDRVVPLTPEALSAVVALRERALGGAVSQRTKNKFVIVDESGEPMAPWTFSTRIRQLAAEAGLPEIKVHGIRHSVATTMLKAHVPVHVAAGLLGHTPAVLMKTYAHVISDDRAEGIEALRQAMQKR